MFAIVAARAKNGGRQNRRREFDLIQSMQRMSWDEKPPTGRAVLSADIPPRINERVSLKKARSAGSSSESAKAGSNISLFEQQTETNFLLSPKAYDFHLPPRI